MRKNNIIGNYEEKTPLLDGAVDIHHSNQSSSKISQPLQEIKRSTQNTQDFDEKFKDRVDFVFALSCYFGKVLQAEKNNECNYQTRCMNWFPLFNWFDDSNVPQTLNYQLPGAAPRAYDVNGEQLYRLYIRILEMQGMLRICQMAREFLKDPNQIIEKNQFLQNIVNDTCFITTDFDDYELNGLETARLIAQSGLSDRDRSIKVIQNITDQLFKMQSMDTTRSHKLTNIFKNNSDRQGYAYFHSQIMKQCFQEVFALIAENKDLKNDHNFKKYLIMGVAWIIESITRNKNWKETIYDDLEVVDFGINDMIDLLNTPEQQVAFIELAVLCITKEERKEYHTWIEREKEDFTWLKAFFTMMQYVMTRWNHPQAAYPILTQIVFDRLAQLDLPQALTEQLVVLRPKIEAGSVSKEDFQQLLATSYQMQPTNYKIYNGLICLLSWVATGAFVYFAPWQAPATVVGSGIIAEASYRFKPDLNGHQSYQALKQHVSRALTWDFFKPQKLRQTEQLLGSAQPLWQSPKKQ